MKEIWVYLATTTCWFDTGTIVQFIDQEESDSYFRGVGLVEGVPTIIEDIFFDELEYVKLEIRE
jgi:hypothetical protein